MLDCECNRADCGFGGGAGLLDRDDGVVFIDRSEGADGCGFDLLLFPVKYDKKKLTVLGTKCCNYGTSASSVQLVNADYLTLYSSFANFLGMSSNNTAFKV